MLTGLQAARLRGLIARHARCQWNLAATLGDAGEPRRQIIVDDAEAASRAVFASLRQVPFRTFANAVSVCSVAAVAAYSLMKPPPWPISMSMARPS